MEFGSRIIAAVRPTPPLGFIVWRLQELRVLVFKGFGFGAQALNFRACELVGSMSGESGLRVCQATIQA